MEILGLLLAGIVQVVLLIVFFVKLGGIAKNTEVGTRLAFYRKYTEDEVLNRTSKKMRSEPSGDGRAPSWADPASPDLHYFLDFFDFVAQMKESGLVRPILFRDLFAGDIRILANNRQYLSDTLQSRTPALSRLLDDWR